MGSANWRKRGRLRLHGIPNDWIPFEIVSWNPKVRVMIIAAPSLPVTGGVNRLRTDTGLEALCLKHIKFFQGWADVHTGTYYDLEAIYDPRETPKPETPS